MELKPMTISQNILHLMKYQRIEPSRLGFHGIQTHDLVTEYFAAYEIPNVEPLKVWR